MLMHINSIQLEILRRATQQKQDESKALVTQKFEVTSLIDGQRTPPIKLLPTLPNETIAQIFSYLYWFEDDRRPGHPVEPEDGTTLQRLLDDDDINDEWKNLINEQIPCLLKTSGADANLRVFGPHLGPHPTILSIRDLHRDTEDIVERSSTTIVVNLSKGMQAIEDLECIRQKTWHNVFISEFGEIKTSTEPMDAIKALVQKFGKKLAGLDRLELYETSQNTFANNLEANGGALTEDSGSEVLSLQLAHAHLPTHFLPIFHPILSSISELETTVPVLFGADEMSSDLDGLFQALASCSDSLSSLTIMNAQSALTVNRPREGCHLLFPQLKRLCLNAFTKDNILDVLSAMSCPLLSHFTLNMYVKLLSMDGVSDGRTECPISARTLNDMFSNLEFISVSFGEFDVRPIPDSKNIQELKLTLIFY